MNSAWVQRTLLRFLGIVPKLAACNTDRGSGMGTTRWIIERTNAFLHGSGRLRRCLDRVEIDSRPHSFSHEAESTPRIAAAVPIESGVLIASGAFPELRISDEVR